MHTPHPVNFFNALVLFLDFNGSLNALENFARSDFRKGTIKRELYGNLDWSELEWNIYNVSRSDARLKVSTVKRQTAASYNTTKKHFYDKVLPSCIIAHYFFPKGYPLHQQLVLKLNSKYEEGIVNGLQKLLCTSYIFPLEKSLFIALFHENTNFTLDIIQKLEERAIIDDYLLFNPLTYHIPD
ncbi:MAG: hypothetical protein HXS44_12460 [Theionarchaea archaeon]|nr:hypothetical protein [Theionarchaea archaeon]